MSTLLHFSGCTEVGLLGSSVILCWLLCIVFYAHIKAFRFGNIVILGTDILSSLYWVGAYSLLSIVLSPNECGSCMLRYVAMGTQMNGYLGVVC